ncbi:HNH endonuclease signature motif containing protein [Janthinobacterium sp. TND4EL3]|uniref:HNH endonuclease signature motif containing protein n=1 Tax=Janthinobacterium sp. TND4EL3 TaxID=1907311 RepID=UPI000970DFE3|nr:HNH endonuclease signature motif containing protein [Janthinobacterium sp. TND4EL3]
MKASKVKEAALTAERLRELFDYDPSIGVFIRKVDRRGKGAVKGAIAGTDNGRGYTCISIDGFNYRAHRLAYLYMLDRWPTDEVDHMNGCRSDNRWSNLRELSTQKNTQNQRKPHRHNSTGYLGVKFYGGKFRAVINVEGRRIFLGVHPSAEAAHAAYVAAKQTLHSSCTI